MYKAILLDLDDTLLGNNMDTFIPRYFGMLKQYADGLELGVDLMQELLICTQATIRNSDPALTNREVFWALFAQRTGLDRDMLEPTFDAFYVNQFPQMRDVSQFRPNAPRLIDYCLTQGYQVVIATNPLFPQRAIEERLAWAGIPVDRCDYALVTTYDNMHATKPNHAYYAEILDRVGVTPQQTIMVGDSWDNDIVPANALGLDTFWISDGTRAPPDATLINGHGSLAAFFTHLQALAQA
jgi:HAD superfamily hydrolase (TIGR01549 family)